jgi:hypothetical protein
MIFLNRWSACEPGVTAVNFQRLHIGMSASEVESIMGGQGRFLGQYTDNHAKTWEGDGFTIMIRFQDFGEQQAIDGNLFSADGTEVFLRQSTPGLVDRIWRTIRKKLR